MIVEEPTVVEGESMKSMENNRLILVDQWWYSSSNGAEQLRVSNTWSVGLKPTVFHEVFQVNSAAATEGVRETTVGDGNAQVDEHRWYDYKDETMGGGGGGGGGRSVQDSYVVSRIHYLLEHSTDRQTPCLPSCKGIV
jgi:hypothetical protein